MNGICSRLVIFVAMATALFTLCGVEAGSQNRRKKPKKSRVDWYHSPPPPSYNGSMGYYSNDDNWANSYDEYAMVGAARLTDEQRLMMKLFGNYDRYARPVRNISEAVTISISLTLTQIFELDEKNQVLITNAWTNLEWVDQHMNWDPAEFSGLTMVRIVSSKLWLPDIVLYNNAADFSPNVLETRAMVSNEGYIFWSVPTKFFSSCKIDVTYFPFDEQKCRMKFGSWTFDGFKVDLINSSTTVDLSLYIRSGEWDLINALQKRNVVVYTCCVEPYPDVTFYFHIKRKPLYYIVNVFLPCMVMSGLTLLVFMMPAESGEKCGLGITIMLAFAVFMLSVIERLPDTSESFPLISIYLTVVISTTAISIIISVSLLTLNYKASRTTKIRPWLNKILDKVSPLCCVTVKADSGPASESSGNSEESSTRFGSHGSLILPGNNSYVDYGDYAAVGTSGSSASVDSLSRRAVNRQQQGSSSSSSSSSNHPLTAREMLKNLVNDLNESARAMVATKSSCGVYFQNYAEVADGLSRLLDRDQEEDDAQQMMATWRRIAQFIDRTLFWLLLAAASFFAVFLLVLAPSQQLL